MVAANALVLHGSWCAGLSSPVPLMGAAGALSRYLGQPGGGWVGGGDVVRLVKLEVYIDGPPCQMVPLGSLVSLASGDAIID